MPSEEKYSEIYSEGGKLVDGLLQVDRQKIKKLTFFQKRKLKKAKGLFELAAIESPENGAPFFMIAKIEQRLGEHEKSLSYFQKAWLLEPHTLIVIIELSGAYVLLGKYQEAISILIEGRKQYPNEPRVLFTLGISFLLIGQTKPAIEIFTDMIELESDYEMNHQMLAYSKDVLAGKKPTPKDYSEILRSI
jgi:tetratricopeptide (TPR) repeat protein